MPDAAAPRIPHQTVESAIAPVEQFFIPATSSLQERRPRTLKHGDTFGLFDPNGDVISGPGSPEGLFHRDTRYLSHLYLTIEGARPLLLSSTLRGDNATLVCDLTNPDLHDAGGQLVLAHDVIHIRRSRFLYKATLYERLAVRSFDGPARRIRLELSFAADFADIFEVRGMLRARRGTIHAPRIEPSQVVLAYTGLDDVRRETAIRFHPAPALATSGYAVLELDLKPGDPTVVYVEVGCETKVDMRPAGRRFFRAMLSARRDLRTSARRAARVTTSNDIFNEAIRRSFSDLQLLITETPEGPYPYAGIPWFSAVFGRDAIITALETLWLDPEIAKGVLRHLAANQAKAEDRAADAEPGKILHEVRFGEMAELAEVPFRRYYGSVDSTPLFVMLAGAYFERTGDLPTIAALWGNIEAALSWIDRYGDRDGDGFIEYGRKTSEGLVNQGWKDSHDSVFHADGSLASGPIAICEVQAFVYGAFRAAARLAAELGKDEREAALDLKADRLRAAFEEAFWDEELATYVLALDGDKRPCRARASNAGYVLFTGLASADHAAAVARELTSSRFFSGWGVRTVASTEARYNPMSYHNGSVWPHDNAIVAAGLARYGFRREAIRIFEGLFAAAEHIDLRRLPELFCGFPRKPDQGPTFYPVACSPQAWAAAAPLMLLQACLGLDFAPAEGGIRFTRPVLPGFVERVTLSGLWVPGGKADVAVRRTANGPGDEVSVTVLARSGQVHVTTRY